MVYEKEGESSFVLFKKMFGAAVIPQDLIYPDLISDKK